MFRDRFFLANQKEPEMTTTTSDRDRLLAAVTKSSFWLVSDFGHGYTDLVRGSDQARIGWKDGDKFDHLAVSPAGATQLTVLDDHYDAKDYLTGARHKDAEGARYFEVTAPADADLVNYAVNESDKNFAPVRRTRLSSLEHGVVLDIAQDARALGRVMGSHRATNIHTVFGVELHVTWKRGGVS
jgi:hypothetical protein